MGLLRACADAVLVGSGTMHAAPADARGPPSAPIRRPPRRSPSCARGSASRRARARDRRARAARSTSRTLCSSSGALVLTTEDGAAALGDACPAPRRPSSLAGRRPRRPAGRRRLPPRAGPRADPLRGRARRVRSLLAAGLVDELFLTVSPLLAGRTTRSRPQPGRGAELLPRAPVDAADYWGPLAPRTSLPPLRP